MSFPSQIKRRVLLQRTAALALATATPRAWTRSAAAQIANARFDCDPFSLGVASGPGLEGGVVLWTRMAPDIHADIAALSALPLERYLAERRRLENEAQQRVAPIEVLWEVARDEAFTQIVQHGSAMALPELAHSVHVEIPAAALTPGQTYWYRFMCGAAVSTTGRTMTLPSTTPGAWRVALASCQHYEYGHFGAYAHMRNDDPHAVLFVGDYLYEGGPSRNRFRAHPFPQARSRFDYRLRHALYRLDSDLQRMHAHCPWWVMWDDHEVSNDYAGNQGENRHLDGAARRQAAYQAYYEHMPLPAAVLARGFDEVRLYRRLRVGSLLEVNLLDDRQYRDVQACQSSERGGSSTVSDVDCPQRLDPKRTLLGQTQMKWLAQGFAQSGAHWNWVAQQTLMAPLQRPFAPSRYWTDGWEGYPAERERVLSAMQHTRLRNPVVLGGDVHVNWVCDLKRDFSQATSAAIATEFCGTSITSASQWSAARTAQVVHHNPHVRFGESTQRGYALMDLSAREMRVALRVVDDVRKKQPLVSTLAQFVVADGVAGAQRV